MTPLGFSGGSHDRLSVSEVERIRWTVGTAEGAVGGHQREQYIITLVLESVFISKLAGPHSKLPRFFLF